VYTQLGGQCGEIARFVRHHHFFRTYEVVENSHTVPPIGGDGTTITQYNDLFIVKPSLVLLDPN
jgi:hypothetical protein